STVGAAEYPLSFVSLAYDAAVPSGIPGPEPDLPERLGEWSGDVDGPGTAHFLWEEGVRASEAAILRTRSAETGVGPAVRAPTGPAAVPQVGEKRIFKVYRSDGTFADVTAEALYVGARAAIFVDQAAPAGGFTSADLAFLSGQFDDLIGPTVTDVFGAESDLDGNARVVILLTPEVNRLTARGSDGFVGGFFYGLDLLADQENSNGGEIFYTLVPDPDGSFSDPRSRAQILMVVPAVLAHEFQHMVHFNQRILQLKAENAEALWLSEALAQMAEELVARADVSGSYVESYRRGNRVRARRYLAAPASASLIVNTGQGSLEERGAGWLHVLYASAQGDAPVVLRDLTRTTRTGVANIEAVAGRRWADLLGDWWSALYLDGTALPVGTELGFPGVDLQSVLTSPGDPGFPLVPAPVGGSDFLLESAFLSASAAFYLVAPPGAGTASVALGGGTAGVLRAEVGARLRIIRVR
ncbi:MAG: hypothetical protein OEZ37_12975, partial [Gemmatimonadota bacterium]|nr:hypothetical protein [Gemmatimonadota bacterium]